MPAYGPLDLLILQSNSACNLNCSYCYLSERDRQQKNIMSMTVLAYCIENILTSEVNILDSGFQLCWHAGEPLLLPIDYYDKQIALIEKIKNEYKPKNSVKYSFQTNATLINYEWASFFKSQNMMVGVSVDGPQFLHDANRKNWSGTGSFKKVFEGIKVLKSSDIELTGIAVITAETLKHPKAFIRFFIENGFKKLTINIDEATGYNSLSSFTRANEKDFFYFVKTILAEIEASNTELKITGLENLVYFLGDDSIEWVNKLTKPFTHISVRANGDWSTFCPELLTLQSENKEENFIVGNFLEDDDSLKKAIESKKLRLIQNAIDKGVESCRAVCDYFMFCKGGFPSNKYAEHNTLEATETIQCKYTKKIMSMAFFEHLEEATKFNSNQHKTLDCPV